MPARRLIEVIRPAPRQPDPVLSAQGSWVLAAHLVKSRYRAWCCCSPELKDDMAASVLAALDQEQAAAERLEAVAR